MTYSQFLLSHFHSSFSTLFPHQILSVNPFLHHFSSHLVYEQIPGIRFRNSAPRLLNFPDKHIFNYISPLLSTGGDPPPALSMSLPSAGKPSFPCGGMEDEGAGPGYMYGTGPDPNPPRPMGIPGPEMGP